MAGPVARVLVPLLDAGLIPPDVLETLSGISADVNKTGPSEYDLRITDTRAVGGDYRGEGRPFVFQAQRADLEEPERSRIHIEFGVEPIREFVIIAMCNGKEDNRILAEIALHLAMACGGASIFAVRYYPPDGEPDRVPWKAHGR